jgi:hypothetical protein
MAGRIHKFLAADHARLDGLLNRALAKPDTVDYEPYAEFRAGLLKHIGMEEKVLLPAVQRKRGAEALPVAKKLRLDHGALAALLVPTPTRAILATIRKILVTHNALEEGPGGVYEVCEGVTGDESDEIVRRLEVMPEVSLARHVDGSQIMEAMGRALSRAGHELAEPEQTRPVR